MHDFSIDLKVSRGKKEIEKVYLENWSGLKKEYGGYDDIVHMVNQPVTK